MVTAHARPEKEGYLLVHFRHGDVGTPIFERYTDWNREVEGHTSTPALEVDLPENTGSFDDKEARIMLPVDAFTSQFSRPEYTNYPIYLQIEEVTAGLFSGDLGTRKVLWKGRVTRSISNFQGRNDTVAFFSLPIKSRLDVPMGLQCNHHCFARLFGRICQLDQVTFQKFGQIAVIDGKEITISANAGITAPTSPGGNVDRYWERGFLEKDGLSIGIHIWVLSDPTKFILRRRPPDSWLLAGGSSIKFVPGCHKTVEDCRDVWDNEDNFAGYGYAMLPYNPMFESPQ